MPRPSSAVTPRSISSMIFFAISSEWSEMTKKELALLGPSSTRSTTTFIRNVQISAYMAACWSNTKAEAMMTSASTEKMPTLTRSAGMCR